MTNPENDENDVIKIKRSLTWAEWSIILALITVTCSIGLIYYTWQSVKKAHVELNLLGNQKTEIEMQLDNIQEQKAKITEQLEKQLNEVKGQKNQIEKQLRSQLDEITKQKNKVEAQLEKQLDEIKGQKNQVEDQLTKTKRNENTEIQELKRKIDYLSDRNKTLEDHITQLNYFIDQYEGYVYRKLTGRPYR
jgi:chromosome segregation ATPase